MPHVLSPPSILPTSGFEVSVHSMPRLLNETARAVFVNSLSDAGAAAGATLLAVPTWQPSELDLTVYPSEAVSVERDRLLIRLRALAAALAANLAAKGEWADASCPLSGYALLGARGGITWNELEGLNQLLRYDHEPAGCCGIVLHPSWGKGAYPATLFTTASAEQVLAALAEVDGQFVEPAAAAAAAAVAVGDKPAPVQGSDTCA